MGAVDSTEMASGNFTSMNLHDYQHLPHGYRQWPLQCSQPGPAQYPGSPFFSEAQRFDHPVDLSTHQAYHNAGPDNIDVINAALDDLERSRPSWVQIGETPSASEMATFKNVPGELRARYVKDGQDHVFEYVDAGKLTVEQAAQLVAQLESIDTKRIGTLFVDAMEFDAGGQDDLGELEPLDSYGSTPDASAEQKSSWQKTGLDAISRGEVCAPVLAGGAGTRLGFDKPKGMYSIGLPSGKTLFQLFAERLMSVSKLAGASKPMPWYIMTSLGDNHAYTEAFFKENNYFGYGAENVTLFSQGTLPCLTLQGKIMLETGYKVGTAADGNGGIYAACQNTGAVSSMAARGVKYVHCFSVDNAISKVGDPIFMGYCLQQGSDLGNKVVWKAQPGEKVGVVGKRGGKYAVIEYTEMKEADCELTDANGKLVYGAGNVCNHFYTVDFLERVEDKDLTFHVARKKIKTPTEDGQGSITPDANSGIKLEAFIFDCFGKARNMAVLEGARDEEFSPVKNPPGSANDSPDSARAMLTAQSVKWLRAAGVTVADGPGQLEISPLKSYNGEGLEGVVGPIQLDKDVHIR